MQDFVHQQFHGPKPLNPKPQILGSPLRPAQSTEISSLWAGIRAPDLRTQYPDLEAFSLQLLKPRHVLGFRVGSPWVMAEFYSRFEGLMTPDGLRMHSSSFSSKRFRVSGLRLVTSCGHNQE